MSGLSRKISGNMTFKRETEKRLYKVGVVSSCYSKNVVINQPTNIDFIFIDSSTSHSEIWENLCFWYPKVRIGGIIGGQFYKHPAHTDVTKAIDAFFSRFGWTIYYSNDYEWWVEKKLINISYFMPAFNCADTIKESVESIIDGNITDGDELVIVDDGSTDDTAEVLGELERKYDFIKYIKHFSNRGGGAARNTAVEACRHNILFCLDSDNLLEAGSVCKLKRTLEDIGADVASFQELHYFKQDFRVTDFKWEFKAGWLTIDDHLSSKLVPGASGNYLFTKASWAKASGYPEVVLDTWGFGIRQIFTGAKMYVMPDSFYYHRYGHESYWMRGAERKKGAVCLMALQILLPFSDMIDEKYLDYIMSRKGRYTWFYNLQKRPIRLVRERKKIRAWDDEQQETAHYARRIMSRIKQSARLIVNRLALVR